MEVIIIKMPLEHWKLLDVYPREELKDDWIIVEQYHETEEIKQAEIALKQKEQELKDLRKKFFELKHPKK